MKNLTFYLIVIIIVLAGLSYTFYDLNKKNKDNFKRWEQNAIQTNLKIQEQNLTLREFKKYMDIKTDSILEIAKIKAKAVTQITNYNTYYKDTTIIENKLEYEPKIAAYPFEDKTGCFEFSGSVLVLDTIPYLSVNKRVFKSDFYDIEHYKKDTMHFLGLNLVKWWQKPRLTYTIIDKCTGETYVKKFNIK